MNNLKPLVTTKKQQSPIGRSIFLLSGFVGLAFPVLSSGELQTTNTGYGSLALYYIETGYGSAVNNSAFGKDALYSDLDGSNNTGVGYYALSKNRIGYSNVAIGWSALYSNTVGAHNTATGNEALYTNTADFNTATGSRALYTNSTGTSNTASGYATLYNNTSGSDNTAVGTGALTFNSSGSKNVAIGSNAGANLTTGGNNIIIGANVKGAAADASVTRIGNTSQKKTFIGGIYNKTVASGVGVIVNSNGQIGTVQSSARYKDDIKPMDKASEAILTLKPVTFRYKEELDPDKTPQFGLIAEEVEKIDPNLIVRDEEGKVMTVRYDAVNAMLLNEFLKEHHKLEDYGRELLSEKDKAQEQDATIHRLESLVTAQAKRIENLDATLQKVSARVELQEPMPRLTAND